MVIRRRRPQTLLTMSDEMRVYLHYIVRSLDDIRATLYALSSGDAAAIQAMITKLKESDDALDQAIKDVLTQT